MTVAFRFANAWKLIKLSWRVLMADKELLLFPFFSAVFGLLLMFVLERAGVQAFTEIIIWYFCVGFVVIFMNAALFACVKKRLHGGNPTILYGLKQAAKRVVPLLLWSILATTVSILFKILESKSRDSFFAKIMVRLLGLSWTLATLFVVPAIVVENKGVLASLRQSVYTLRNAWGETIILHTGLSVVFVPIFIILGLVFFAVFFKLPLTTITLTVMLVCLALMLISLLFMVTIKTVSESVLYAWATGDKIPKEFKETFDTVITKER